MFSSETKINTQTITQAVLQTVQRFSEAGIENLSYKERMKWDRQKELPKRLKYSLQYLWGAKLDFSGTAIGNP